MTRARSTYGNVPAKERDVLLAVRQWFRARGLFVMRFHPVRPIGINGAVQFVRVAEEERGAPDLLVFPRHHVVAVECKGTEGTQSPDQRRWQERWEELGNLYVLVRSVDDLERAWPIGLF